jgi:HEAT repeat protein
VLRTATVLLALVLVAGMATRSAMARPAGPVTLIPRNLRSSDRGVRRDGLRRFLACAPRDHGSILPELLDLALESDDWLVRWEIRRALIRAGDPTVVREIMKRAIFDGRASKQATRFLGEIAREKTTLSRRALADVVWASRHDEDQVRTNSIWVLGHVAVHVPHPVPLILDALHDESARVRRAAVIVLGRAITIDARHLVPPLLGMFEDTDEGVRAGAARALVDGEAACPDLVVPALRALLADPSVSVREAAARSLAKFGCLARPAITDLIAALVDDGAGEVRMAAALALGEIGDFRAIPALCGALADEAARMDAATALGLFGGGARRAVRALQAVIVTDDQDEVIEALSRIGGPESRRAILRAAHHEDWHWGWGSTQGVGRLGPNAQPLVSAIIAQMDKLEDGPCSVDLCALGRIGGRRAVAALLRTLREQRDLTEDVLSALAIVGADGRTAVRTLAIRLRTGDPDEAGWTADALGGIGGPAARVALRDAIGHTDARVREAAVLALADAADGEVEQVLPDLLWALGDEEPPVRAAAAVALGHLGPAAAEAISPLRHALLDSDGWVSGCAAEALGRFGPEAIAALEDLTRLAANECDMAVEAIGRIGETTQEVNSVLTRNLSHEDFYLRWASATALVRIGAADQAVLRRLWLGLDDTDCSVRRAAAASLLLLGVDSDPVLEIVRRDLGGGPWSDSQGLAALIMTGRDVEASLRVLRRRLDPDDGAIESAADAIADIGPAAAVLEPELRLALTSTDTDDRRAVRRALRSVLGR